MNAKTKKLPLKENFSLSLLSTVSVILYLIMKIANQTDEPLSNERRAHHENRTKRTYRQTPGNRRKLQTILYEDEKLELLYCGHQYASAYALIRRKDGMYYSFRFSDHKTTPYYSSKTFDIYAPITSEVLRNIRETLDKVSWCPFTLYDYLTLRTIYYFNNLRQPFCIDNTMNIFVGNKMGLLFYRRKRIGKDNWEFETVSESFQKELRKLFATGLLHAYTCKKTRSIQVYITEAGLSIIKDTDLENNNFVKHYLQFKTDPTFSSCLQLPTQNKKYKLFRSPMDNPPEQMVE